MTRVGFWLAFWVTLLLLPADLAQAQAQHEVRGRIILWAEPPTIGMFTRDSMEVYDSLPLIATADWPAATDTVLAELAACTHLKAPVVTGPRAWQLRTVAAPMFHVRTRYKGRWYEDQPFIGFTFPSVRRIYVAQEGLYVRGLVKHELLHALLSDNGLDPRHATAAADRLFTRCIKDR